MVQQCSSSSFSEKASADGCEDFHFILQDLSNDYVVNQHNI